MAKQEVAYIMVQQILSIICLILISNLGAMAVDPSNIPHCLGPCSTIENCFHDCVAQGFSKGGTCIGIRLAYMDCCCKWS
ncbi:Serpentine receptor class beta-18 [Gossypium arboreum]|uniref:Serpentine receptor class beta-18 n=1 Tax=Gossypium arboreum TaxID=29729 RepID=A0A0B0MU73_GOSAR|nr:Serpentine receptor class beta-18 [Gossypium arboreum]